MNWEPTLPPAPFTAVTVSVSLVSGSLSSPKPLFVRRLSEIAADSVVAMMSFCATGASLTPAMVIVTVAVSVLPLSSETV